MKIHFLLLKILFLIISASTIFSQTCKNEKTWDNQLYIGNKIAAGKNSWRYSGELQVRLEDNTPCLDNYFLEGVAAYMPS